MAGKTENNKGKGEMMNLLQGKAIRNIKGLLLCVSIAMLPAQHAFAVNVGHVEMKDVHVKGSNASEVISSFMGIVVKKGIEQARKKAADGDADAQNTLGEAYQQGQGVPQSHEEAVKWFTLAANQGHAAAQYHLSMYYKAGTGVPRDADKALALLRQSAEQNYVQAQIDLAVYFAKGKQKDTVKSLQWLQRAAANGSGRALNNLGYMYIWGKGLEKDEKKGFSLLQQAAQAGNDTGMVNLSICYDKGIGTKADPQKGLSWLTKAAKKGDPAAQYRLGIRQKNGLVWIKKSAEQGFSAAQFNLGMMYILGSQGAEKDARTGFYWLVRAQGSGSKQAEYTLNETAKWIGSELLKKKNKKQARKIVR